MAWLPLLLGGGTREDAPTWAQRGRGEERQGRRGGLVGPDMWEDPPESLTLASRPLARRARSSSPGSRRSIRLWSPSSVSVLSAEPSPDDCPLPAMGLLLWSLQPLPRAAPRGLSAETPQAQLPVVSGGAGSRVW